MNQFLNLKNVHVLVVDSDHFGLALLVQMLHGLGLKSVQVAETGLQARKELEGRDYELCICEAQLPDMPGADLVRWLRRLPTQKRYLPTLMLTGYSDFGDIAAFRDAGAHLVLKKPASPQTLYDRIAWISRPPRDFIECEGYVGPDRRFKSAGPPGGVPRRATDFSTNVDIAGESGRAPDEIPSSARSASLLADQAAR